MAEVLNRKNKQGQHSSSRTGVRKLREMELNVWQTLHQGGTGNGSAEFEVRLAGVRDTIGLGDSGEMSPRGGGSQCAGSTEGVPQTSLASPQYFPILKQALQHPLPVVQLPPLSSNSASQQRRTSPG